MKSTLVLYLLLLVGATNACSIIPNVPYYTVTQRTVLSPIVVHGRVLNTTSFADRYKYKACIQILQVIKGDKNLPREICFGDFGADELCLTHVFSFVEYIFYMTSDRKANYEDGEPKSSAVVANVQTIGMAKRGICDPILSQSSSCRRPTISRDHDFKSTVRVQEGQTADMVCHAKGSSPIIVIWSKRGARNGWESTKPRTSSTLRLRRVSMSDMGVYVCKIWNPAGQATALVRLFVDPLPCGTFLYLRPGQQAQITSPYYPQSYRKDKMCSWRICPSPGQRVKLDFKDFNFRPWNSDNLQVYHECKPERSTLKYCGSSSPGVLVSKCASRCIQVWFKSENYRTIRRSFEYFRFHAIASATDEATALFDYQRLYCNNEHLIKFIPKDINYKRMIGRVVHNFKNSRAGKQITIHFENRFNIKGLFGCRSKVHVTKEYYVGATTSTPGHFKLNFAAPANSRKIPKLFEAELNKFRTTPPKCRPRGIPHPSPKVKKGS